jgi:uncharacterized membrane protein
MADMADPNELLVVAYPGENTANEVLKTLQQLDHEHLIHVKNAAVIVRHQNGKAEIHETHDFDAKQGALAGALAGGLIGLLRGEVIEGAALGAAGGFVASKVIDLGFNDHYLRDLSESLTPGSSAIVAVVTFDHLDEAMGALAQYHGGRVIRQTLPADVAQRLSAAVQ